MVAKRRVFLSYEGIRSKKMFNLKKGKSLKLYAPVNGTMISLADVPDKVFASEMMGQGVAFVYDDNLVCAPCDGRITLIPSTLHAFGMIDATGAEILVHIGLDTVNLRGKGFKALVEQGCKVKKGTPVIEIDREFMKENDIVLTTPVVITNSSDFAVSITLNTVCERGITEILTCTKK